MVRSASRHLCIAVAVSGLLLSFAPATFARTASRDVPLPRYGMAMAYDPARGQTVMFGGLQPHTSVYYSDTWTWDGATWTKRRPAHHPPGRAFQKMVYDAAMDRMVLFGGHDFRHRYHDTWTWDGTDWRKLSPPHSPPYEGGFGMAYDAARGEVVLLGDFAQVSETWTWDGTDWTKRSPAHSPSARILSGMVGDDARSQVVLFGGWDDDHGGVVNDTWTWNGTDWKQRTPTHAPPARGGANMTFDSSHDRVLLFSGDGYVADTWTWDGADWTQVSPAHSPMGRAEAGFVFDAARSEAVLFDGAGNHEPASDTWVWNGTDWALSSNGVIRLAPASGPPGTVVQVTGKGFEARARIRIVFVDVVRGKVLLRKFIADSTGAFTVSVRIPADARPGSQRVRAHAVQSGEVATRGFTVT